MRWWFPLAVSAVLLGAGATRVGSRRLMATIRSRRLSCSLLAAEPPAERQFDGHPVVSPATLLHPHTDFAQRYWTALLRAGDTVIDATVGNGHDAAVLAEALGRAGGGTLLCVDAQAVALERSQERLRGVLAEWQLREGVDEWLAVQRSSGVELVVRWAAGWPPNPTAAPNLTLASTLALTRAQTLARWRAVTPRHCARCPCGAPPWSSSTWATCPAATRA